MMRSGTGMTLIELLVVLSIIVAAFAMLSFSFARSDGRLQQVKAAAEELAATCRQARALAISRNATYAVVFHVQNDPGSNGRVLNNRSGGHWYRIVGPSSSVGSSTGASRQAMGPARVDNIPVVVGSLNSCLLGISGKTIISSPFNIAQMTAGLRNGWAGEQHTLPAGKVRFLSLTDMDYGDFASTGTRRVPSTTGSYPRPWFGWWDQANAAGGGAGRLYPWGGYDPGIPGSGFYYWGSATASGYAPLDPQPVHSTHAATRTVDRWVEGQQAPNSSGNSSLELPAFPAADVLYAVGSPRPLIDGAWRDMSILFTASGEAQWGGTLPGRHCEQFKDGAIAGTPVKRGAAERCNGIFETYGMVNQHVQAEAGNFDRDSGGFFITLAPDAATDQDVFPSAKAAQDSLMPLMRVFVSTLGQVQVVAVSPSANGTGGLSPFPTNEAWWRNPANMKQYFGQDRLVTGSRLDTSGTGIGEPEGGGPITDFLTPGMMTDRSVWLK